MKRWRRQFIIGITLALGLAGVARGTGAGDPSMASNSYSINESEIGGTGDYASASGHYSFVPGTDDGGSTLGDNFVGNSASSNYQSNSGFNTTAQPGLTMVVNNPTTVGLGTLSTTAATFATATFDVTDSTSYGYVVQIIGSPPTNSGHALTALSTDTASSAGTEQFGINTVFNTVAGFGANPTAPPNGINSQGVAGDGVNNFYTQSDKYRYVSGETIGSSPKSSGDTRFTITFMANISTTTPGGQYTGSLNLVATGTY